MLGIISDIHGNYPALQAVLTKLDKLGCKDIISLGDVCGYYCMVNECINELKDRGITNILGNHDFYIVNNEKCGRSYSANLCLDYQRKILTKDNIEWLKKSVTYIRMDNMWLVHGGWHDYLDEYVTDFSFLDKENTGISIYISGHTHVQKRVDGEWAVYFNPGSVGQPRDYDSRAAYATINGMGEIKLERVEYDVECIDYAMKRAGFPKRISSCLYDGTKIGENEK